MPAVLVAAAGLLVWWIVLVADGRPLATAFALGVLFAMPFLLLAAAVEAAGALDAPRTRGLAVAAAGTAIEVAIVFQGFAPLVLVLFVGTPALLLAVGVAARRR